MNVPPASVRRRDREVWVGLLVVLAAAAVLGLLFAIADPAVLRGRYTVTLVVSDAQGMRRGDPVRLRGVTVGRVRDFAIAGDSVAMTVEIEKRYPVPADSRVVVRAAGVLGEMVVDVLPGTSAELLRDGATLAGERAPGVVSKVQDVTTELSAVLGRVQSLLSDRTVSNVETATDDLVRLIAVIERLTTNLADVTGAPDLSRTLGNLELATSELAAAAETFEGAAATAGALLSRVDKGEGSLGRLARDERLYTDADAAVRSINAAASELLRLVHDIRENPRRYFDISVF